MSFLYVCLFSNGRHRMLRGNPYLPDGAGNGSE